MLTLQLLSIPYRLYVFFFFNDTATTEIYTLSLHDALPVALASSATATLTARSGPLVEEGSVSQLRLRAVVRGVATGVERGGPELAALVHRVEIQAELRLAVRAQQALFAELDDALQRLEAGVGGQIGRASCRERG